MYISVIIIHQDSALLGFVYTWDLILDRCEIVYNRDRDRLRRIRDYYNTWTLVPKPWPHSRTSPVNGPVPGLISFCICRSHFRCFRSSSLLFYNSKLLSDLMHFSAVFVWNFPQTQSKEKNSILTSCDLDVKTKDLRNWKLFVNDGLKINDTCSLFQSFSQFSVVITRFPVFRYNNC